ncbi:cytochrome P450 [Oryctes borbonicus]|uniref:Cytochrome P450 n=1 Tax=Oryctes borbonicus TaxID=1629725 RepID=A0A0T6AYY8_9SCAR|nr:cytochrome P450 [Oryctes borbonicus]
MFWWNLFLNIFGIFVATLILIVVFYKRRYNHWKDLGIEYLQPSFFYGNIKENIHGKKALGTILAEFYNTMRARNLQHAGSYMFHIPVFVAIDLELIKKIMQVDFPHFTDHGGYLNEKDDPLSAHLAALGGQRWRELRVKLTPTFTTGKMKLMFPIIVQIAQELIKVLEKECQNVPIEAKDISARYTTDVIGTCAFGIDCNSLRDPKTEFRVKGSRLFDLNRKEQLANFISFMFPKFAKFLGLRLFPKEGTDFFWKIIKETADYREQNGIRRNDAFQLLLDMKINEETDTTDSDTMLTFKELAAQAFVFFIGGFETSSTMMSFALLEIALNQDVQDKLREEINTVLKRYDDKMEYESLAEMRYLDMVINETLRKYPPIPVQSRECTKDYPIPNTDVIMPKRQFIFIPVQGIHHDPEYYPDPEKFDPTRFSDENKKSIPQFAFLPFGEGPRVCLGQRFALMQSKVGLAFIVKNYKLKINTKTELPVRMDPVKFFTGTIGGLWVDMEKIK